MQQLATARVRSSTGTCGRSGRARVEGNARLTALTGFVLLVLFLIEVVTVLLSPRNVLTLHVTVGLILVPPVLLKIASTTWRMMAYYRGDAAYVENGPPAFGLRVLGPFVVFLTLVVVISGIGLVVIPHHLHSTFLIVHKVSFYLWLAALVIHVGVHFMSMIRLVAGDLVRRPGARRRRMAVGGSLLLGVAIALVLISSAESYLRIYPFN